MTVADEALQFVANERRLPCIERDAIPTISKILQTPSLSPLDALACATFARNTIHVSINAGGLGENEARIIAAALLIQHAIDALESTTGYSSDSFNATPHTKN